MVDATPYRIVLSRLVEDGATDARIARRIGYSAPTVRNIRTGRTKRIHPETAKAIGDMLVGAR
jgi:DNA-binding CsgD family transcriptional regulator